MTPLQWALTIVAWALGLGGLAFAYVVHLANAMKTTGPPLSARDRALALTPALLATGVLLVSGWLAYRSSSVARVALWSSPALVGIGLTLVMTAVAWIGDLPAVRRRATEKRMAAEARAMGVAWSRSGRLPEWDLRVERGIAGALPGSGGEAREGVDWVILYTVDGVDRTVNAWSFPAHGAKIDLERHAQQVLKEVARRLRDGWRPEANAEPLEITVEN